jgi:hypothetical protein
VDGGDGTDEEARDGKKFRWGMTGSASDNKDIDRRYPEYRAQEEAKVEQQNRAPRLKDEDPARAGSFFFALSFVG